MSAVVRSKIDPSARSLAADLIRQWWPKCLIFDPAKSATDGLTIQARLNRRDFSLSTPAEGNVFSV
jgi:hypothetical protein